VAVVVALLVVSLAAGCGSSTSATASARCRDSPGTSGVPAPKPDHAPGVTRFTMMLVDGSRSTPAIPHRAAMPCRLLPTEVRYLAGVTGPLPLVVVAHGLDGNPSSLATLLDAWAGAGYVVAAPAFPTTGKDSNGVSLLSESVDQAADMSFVIDQMLERSRPQGPGPLHGLIDAKRIGAAGMSLGGLSVYGLISNTCCRDTRVRAAILMAAVRRQFPEEQYEDNEAPVLIVQGDADTGYHNSFEAYPELVPPKWFITLHGSGHSSPFEVPPGPEAPLVYRTTAWFWDRYLKHDDTATHRIADAVRASHGRATLRRDLG
jgi:dienelactone hydrolase